MLRNILPSLHSTKGGRVSERREGKGKEEDEREVVGVYQWFDVLKQSGRPHLILDSLLWIYLRRGELGRGGNVSWTNWNVGKGSYCS